MSHNIKCQPCTIVRFQNFKFKTMIFFHKVFIIINKIISLSWRAFLIQLTLRVRTYRNHRRRFFFFDKNIQQYTLACSLHVFPNWPLSHLFREKSSVKYKKKILRHKAIEKMYNYNRSYFASIELYFENLPNIVNLSTIWE